MACLQKKKANEVDYIYQQAVPTVHSISENSQSTLQLRVIRQIIQFRNRHWFQRQFLLQKVWKQLGKPDLQPATSPYYSATKSRLPILGTCVVTTDLGN